MPAPISVVIPTLNGEAALPETLQSLMPALTQGLVREVIFTDGGSRDATLEIAEEVGAVLVEGPPGRGGQLRRGVAAAQGDWLLILHGDTRLEGDWLRGLARHMQGSTMQAGYFPLRFDVAGMGAAWVAGWANWRSRVLALPYGDQGLFLSRALYDRLGGFPDQPLMEDVALARALARDSEARFAVLPGSAVTSAERYLRDGWARRGTRNLWTLLRYFCGVAPERLARGYARTRGGQ